MRDFREFRSKFEGLLAAARKKAALARGAPARRPTRLRELTGFGANPGNLRMFAYAPKDLPPKAPLVIALHGCTQTAAEYDHGSGWSSLADSLGFAVVYPQQQPANNPKNCFSWFLPAAPSLPDCPMGAPATSNKHSRPCSPSRDMPRRRLAIAYEPHPDIAGRGRKSQYGMALTIPS